MVHLLMAARATIAQFWRDLAGALVTYQYNKVQETALLEKLMYKLRGSRGQSKKDRFTSVWFGFIMYVSKEEHGQNLPLAYKCIWLIQ